MLSGLIVNDIKLHSIDSIEFLKVLQQQAITALYHIQFEIKSFCSKGNVRTDILPYRGKKHSTSGVLLHVEGAIQSHAEQLQR